MKPRTCSDAPSAASFFVKLQAVRTDRSSPIHALRADAGRSFRRPGLSRVDPGQDHGATLYDGTAIPWPARFQDIWHIERPTGFGDELAHLLHRFDPTVACRAMAESASTLLAASNPKHDLPASSRRIFRARLRAHGGFDFENETSPARDPSLCARYSRESKATDTLSYCALAGARWLRFRIFLESPLFNFQERAPAFLGREGAEPPIVTDSMRENRLKRRKTRDAGSLGRSGFDKKKFQLGGSRLSHHRALRGAAVMRDEKSLHK